MSELSVFVDESGDLGADSKYYMLTLVFHDQSNDISMLISEYERILRERRLPDNPFHFAPLTHGNDAYSDIDVRDRIRMLRSFATFVWRVPFKYQTFTYKKSWFQSRDDLAARMRRDLILFLFDHLGELRRYEAIKIYYDDGQRLITNVLHGAFEYVLARQALVYRDAAPSKYRLFQLADFVCSIERIACKYSDADNGKTEKLFFGTARDFQKTFLKRLRKHRIQV